MDVVSYIIAAATRGGGERRTKFESKSDIVKIGVFAYPRATAL